MVQGFSQHLGVHLEMRQGMMKCGCGGCGALQNPRPNAWNVARTHDREKDIGADWGK